MAIYDIICAVRNARETLRDWREYKQATGQWPLLSIAVHLANFIILVVIIISLAFYGSSQDWSHWRILGAAALILIPYFVLWSWIDNKVKLNEIRNRRRLSKSGELI